MISLDEFLTDLPLFIGIILLIVCAIGYFFPPKEINYLYGYRTSVSMKSQDRWDFAQEYSLKRMLEYALYLIAAGIALPIFKAGPVTDLVAGMLFIVGMPAYIFITTEKVLKKNFPNP